MGKRGGVGLYLFVDNTCINLADLLGLKRFPSLVGKQCANKGDRTKNLIYQNTDICFWDCEATWQFPEKQINIWVTRILNLYIPGLKDVPGYSLVEINRYEQIADIEGTRITYMKNKYENLECNADCIWTKYKDNSIEYNKIDEWSGVTNQIDSESGCRIVVVQENDRIPRVCSYFVPTGAVDTGSPAGYRDRAMLELLYSTGIRVGELMGID